MINYNGIFSGVKEHLENSYIESASNIVVEAGKMFEWASYIRRNPDLKVLVEDLKSDILSVNHTWNKDVDSVRNKIEDDLFLYAYLASRFHTKTEQRKIYKRFFIGKDSIPNRYIRLKEAGKINTEKMNDPSFMMVLTGTGDFAYRRKDGVYVVPIGCLKD